MFSEKLGLEGAGILDDLLTRVHLYIKCEVELLDEEVERV